jgi:hypothetical protein
LFCQQSKVEQTLHNSWEEIKNSVLTVPGDFKEMGHSLKKDWKKTAICAGGVAGLILTDKFTTTFYQDQIETRIKYSLPNISPKAKFGTEQPVWPFQKNDTYIIYSIGGLYLGSVISNYDVGQRASLNTFKAASYSILISHLILKPITGRLRPDPTLSNGIDAELPYTNNPFNFGNFNKPTLGSKSFGTSFPSFHSTVYVAIAQVMAMEFNNYWIPYGIVSFIFLSDIKGHHHWISDMVTGGLIGGLIGASIVKSSRKFAEKKKIVNQQNKSSVNFELLPSISPNFTGISLIGKL